MGGGALGGPFTIAAEADASGNGSEDATTVGSVLGTMALAEVVLGAVALTGAMLAEAAGSGRTAGLSPDRQELAKSSVKQEISV